MGRVLAVLLWRLAPFRPALAAATEGGVTTDWRVRAELIHREVGGEREAVLALGREIHAARERAAETARAAGFPARVTATVVTAVPLLVGAVRFGIDPAAAARFVADPPAVLTFLLAVGLAAAGGQWLSRVAAPPFRPLPRGWRAAAERAAAEEALAGALDTTALYVAAGLPLQLAIKRTVDADATGTAEPFFDLLDASLLQGGSLVGDDPQRFAVRLALALDGGMATSRALLETAARLRLEQQWRVWRQADGFLTAMLLPLVICVLPAALIVGLGPW